MKILVDKLVKNENDCPFSIWHPYPPIVEATGYYTCDFDRAPCNLNLEKRECNCFKEIEND